MDNSLSEKFNSVSRIHALLSKTRRANAPGVSLTALDVWLLLFDLGSDESDERDDSDGWDGLRSSIPAPAFLSAAEEREQFRADISFRHRLFHFLGLFYDEVGLAHESLRATDMLPDRYESIFSNIYRLFELDELNSRWPSSVDDHQLDLLDLLSLYLPNDDVRLDEETLSNIKIQISDLEKSILSANFPPDVAQFFLGQLGIISDAIREYRICGTKAFHTAIARGVGEAKQYTFRGGSLEEIDNEEVADAWSKIKDLWVWCSERAGEASKIYALIDIIKENTPNLPG